MKRAQFAADLKSGISDPKFTYSEEVAGLLVENNTYTGNVIGAAYYGHMREAGKKLEDGKHLMDVMLPHWGISEPMKDHMIMQAMITGLAEFIREISG